MEEKKSERPIAYLLSTCPRCRKVKKEMDDLGVDYDGIDVDLLSKVERTKILDALRKHRPVISFPVIVIGEKFLFGANVADIRETFGADK